MEAHTSGTKCIDALMEQIYPLGQVNLLGQMCLLVARATTQVDKNVKVF